jgi:hypothetical protein
MVVTRAPVCVITIVTRGDAFTTTFFARLMRQEDRACFDGRLDVAGHGKHEGYGQRQDE